MKKIVMLLFFSIFIIGLSANVDSAKSRETALKEMQSWIDKGIKYEWGKTDCSHYVAAGMAASGLKIPTGSATNGRYTQSMWNSKTNKIPPGQENLLKPGDLVFFNRAGANGIGHVGMVYENPSSQCNGGPLIIDTYTKGEIPRTKCLSKHTGYVGAISHDEIIKANGHTPVNTDGTVIIPAGQSYSGMQGFETEYQRSISFDEIADQFQAIVKERVQYLASALVPLLSLLWAIDLIVFGIRSYLGSSANFIKDFILRCAKFSFFLYVIKNVLILTNTVYKMFNDVAYSLSGVEKASVDSIVDMYIEVTKNLFSSLMTANFAINLLFNGGQAIAFALFLIIVAIALGVAYFQLCFEIFSVTIQFWLAVGLSLTLFPLKVAKITEKFGTDPLSSALVCGTRLIITLIMCGVALQLLEKTQITEEALKSMDYMQLNTIMIYTLVICFLVKKINSTFSQFR